MVVIRLLSKVVYQTNDPRSGKAMPQLLETNYSKSSTLTQPQSRLVMDLPCQCHRHVPGTKVASRCHSRATVFSASSKLQSLLIDGTLIPKLALEWGILFSTMRRSMLACLLRCGCMSI